MTKRSQRGSDRLASLVLLHPNCHMQHHVLEKAGPIGVTMFK
ncbi:MAG: hypothetical protein HZB71_12895 [Betaproteobacteria bacterium]|nr:hypothetical protein [Betaproteobacteria bacterium]